MSVFSQRGVFEASCCDSKENTEVIQSNVWHSRLSDDSTFKRVFSKKQ